MVKWPKIGKINALGETEANLEAGDLIKVRMDVPTANTVDIYCSAYSVKIGGIGEPPWVPAGELRLPHMMSAPGAAGDGQDN